MTKKNQDDPKLVAATKELYTLEFNSGKMLVITGDYANLPVKQAKEKVKRLTKAVTSSILNEKDLNEAPKAIQEYVQDRHIVFKPNTGPQTDFLASPEEDVLYGGAAGGGKSYALLADLLRYADNGSHRALLLRRTIAELTELIDKSRQF
mgnify:CR=1 FL=1